MACFSVITGRKANLPRNAQVVIFVFKVCASDTKRNVNKMKSSVFDKRTPLQVHCVILGYIHISTLIEVYNKSALQCCTRIHLVFLPLKMVS